MEGSEDLLCVMLDVDCGFCICSGCEGGVVCKWTKWMLYVCIVSIGCVLILCIKWNLCVVIYIVIGAVGVWWILCVSCGGWECVECGKCMEMVVVCKGIEEGFML